MTSLSHFCSFIVLGFVTFAGEGVAVADPVPPVARAVAVSAGEKTEFNIESLKQQILTAFGSEGAEASVLLEEGDLDLKYKTRPFWIHRSFKTGEWSEEAREVEGPSHKGIRVRVMIQPATLRRAWDRPTNDAGATIAFESSAPYWKSFIWVMPVADGDKHVFLMLDHGRGADRDILERLKKIFSEVR